MNPGLSSALARLKDRLASERSGAVLSPDRQYRYLLWRQWSGTDRLAMFIALNPSTADEFQDDPTIRRCTGFARDWNASGFVVANLFAYRATKPHDLLSTPEPVGQENDQQLLVASRLCVIVIACWGNHGTHLQRSAVVRALIPEMQSLRINKSGEPCHPLYLPSHLRPTPFRAIN